MSSQTTNGIVFSIVPASDQRHYRLLELPVELLEIIASGPAQILQLKSAKGPPGHENDSNTVLCTKDTTYTVRQVNTSNTVYVTQPMNSHSHESSHLGVAAIAQPQSTLELSRLPTTSASSYIKAVLPVYISSGHYDSRELQSKRELFADLPLSESECETSWVDLACFETEDEPRGAVVPSASAKLRAWERIVATATLEKIDLTQRLGMREEDLLIASGDREWPVALSRAVLRSMAKAQVEDGALQIDEVRCARLVGIDLLRDRTEQSRSMMSTSAFSSAWADLLPEKWRAQAQISLIEENFALSNNTQEITFTQDESGNGNTIAGKVSLDAKSTLGGKRKWHEKLRVSKKTV